MKMKKAISGMLSLMMVFMMITAAANAEDSGTSPGISIGAGNIEKGNKVYMGVRHILEGESLAESPISWIVLGAANSSDLTDSPDTSVDSKNARLLITEKTQDDLRPDPDNGPGNPWQESVKDWCNFFITDKDGVWNQYTESNEVYDRFSENEKSTMLSTSKTDQEYQDEYYNIYQGTSSLVDEKLFFLSAEEVSDEYGYFNGDESRIAYKHDEDGSKGWWLRSPYSNSNTGEAAVVTASGSVEKNNSQ